MSRRGFAFYSTRCQPSPRDRPCCKASRQACMSTTAPSRKSAVFQRVVESLAIELHALAHRRACQGPCRRPVRATVGPAVAAPPGTATAPDRRSCTYARSAAFVASFAGFGRFDARSACHCAMVARYSSPPLRAAALRRSSRETVDAARPSRCEITRTPQRCRDPLRRC